MSSNNNQQDNNTVPTSTSSGKESLEQIMNELSTKYNEQAVNIINTATQIQINRDQANQTQTKTVGPIVILDKDIASSTSNFIQSTLATGAKEFEAKAGRPMTYSEMRAMWG